MLTRLALTTIPRKHTACRWAQKRAHNPDHSFKSKIKIKSKTLGVEVTGIAFA
jgi:hypothetical protein